MAVSACYNIVFKQGFINMETADFDIENFEYKQVDQFVGFCCTLNRYTEEEIAKLYNHIQENFSPKDSADICYMIESYWCIRDEF